MAKKDDMKGLGVTFYKEGIEGALKSKKPEAKAKASKPKAPAPKASKPDVPAPKASKPEASAPKVAAPVSAAKSDREAPKKPAYKGGESAKPATGDASKKGEPYKGSALFRMKKKYTTEIPGYKTWQPEFPSLGMYKNGGKIDGAAVRGKTKGKPC